MGQRHQIYLRLPKVYYNIDNPNNRSEVTVGMHNQWLYGMNAVSSLYRFLKFVNVNKGSTYNPFDNPGIDTGLSILDHVYSIDLETGYHTENYKFPTDKKSEDYDKCCEDPRYGDNNNGITVIDLADLKNPAYCFMSIGHLECLDKSKDDREDSDDPAYVNFAPINVEEWIELHYSNWSTRKDTCVVPERIDFIKQNFKVITSKRLIEIFPKMKTALIQGAKDKEAMRPNSIRLMESLNEVSNAVKKAKPAKKRS